MRPHAFAAATVLAVALAACGGTSDPDAVTVDVTATDTSCELATTTLAAGPVTFHITNGGGQITEVYVYAEGDRVVSEVENIGPQTSRDMAVTLGGGTYEIACKPGQTGDGIRTTVTVSGDALEQPDATREIHVSATDYTFAFAESLDLVVGDVVTFEMDNDGTVEHEFEVLGPDGTALGEVGPTAAGAEGEVTLTFAEAGTYTFVCGISDHEARGMTGTFEVTAA